MSDIVRLFKDAMLSHIDRSQCTVWVDNAERMRVLDEVYESALTTRSVGGSDG